MEKKMIRTVVKIPEDLSEHLEKIGRDQGKDTKTLIEEALIKYVREEGVKIPKASPN